MIWNVRDFSDSYVLSTLTQPTAVSFLTIIRIVSLKSRVSNLIKLNGSNVDNKVQMPILVTMAKCLQRTAKECNVDAAKAEKELQDVLLKKNN